MERDVPLEQDIFPVPVTLNFTRTGPPAAGAGAGATFRRDEDGLGRETGSFGFDEVLDDLELVEDDGDR